jgi:hypothetical protein
MEGLSEFFLHAEMFDFAHAFVGCACTCVGCACAFVGYACAFVGCACAFVWYACAFVGCAWVHSIQSNSPSFHSTDQGLMIISSLQSHH